MSSAAAGRLRPLNYLLFRCLYRRLNYACKRPTVSCLLLIRSENIIKSIRRKCFIFRRLKDTQEVKQLSTFSDKVLFVLH